MISLRQWLVGSDSATLIEMLFGVQVDQDVASIECIEDM